MQGSRKMGKFKKVTLCEYLESLPARGGEKERQRQKRILGSIDPFVQVMRKKERAELKRLESLPSLTLEERRSLHCLRIQYAKNWRILQSSSNAAADSLSRAKKPNPSKKSSRAPLPGKVKTNASRSASKTRKKGAPSKP